MKKTGFSIILTSMVCLTILTGLKAQVVISDPLFPMDNDAVVITFDATQGNGGLAGYTGDVYAHTGVITENSSSPSDWKYVPADWGVNIPKCKMTRIGEDLYQLQITPTLRQYYGVPEGEKILKMAFVFRSAAQVGGQWLAGRTETGGDIFLDVYEENLDVSFINPDKDALIVELNDTIPVYAAGNYSNSLSLYLNDELIQQVAASEIFDTLVATDYGKFWVKVIAANDTGMVADSFYYFVRNAPVFEPLPDGIAEGINYTGENSVALCLYAPFKEYAFVIGDFNDWLADISGYMKRTPDSTKFWLEITGLETGKEYIFQYFVDGEIRIGDPYAEKTSDPWNDQYITDNIYPDLIQYPEGKTSGVATVLQTEQEEYQWQNTSFEPPAITDLVIYELLVRDFTEQHTYLSLIDTLGYLKKLGVNAIELMPVNEFEGNISWGYNPSYYFAPDKYYGPKHTLQQFIDVCHQEGIAVILDVVYNHSFGQSPMVMLYWDKENSRPAENNPWYNPIPKHDYNVGYDFNHESPDTRRFVERALNFWLTEYKIDGFRFDLSKGFTQKNTLGNTSAWGKLDTTRVAILENYADTIWAVKPETYVILEHFAENQEETILINYGMMVWGNENGHFNEVTMGWVDNSDFSWASYQERGWDKPHNVVYMESHDEERMVYRNFIWGNATDDYNTKDSTIALERIGLAAAFFFTIPGPKMIWQFGELGYDYSIDYNGRTGPKPIRWDYYNDWRRKYLHDLFTSLIKIKKEQPFFRSEDYTLSAAGYTKRLNITGSYTSAVVLGNMNLEPDVVDPDFIHPGKWYEFFTGDSIIVTDMNALITLAQGEYRLYTDNPLPKPDLNTGIEKIPGVTKPISWAYPNPSNEGFNIAFELNEPADVEIIVYDMMGKEVRNLYSGRKSNGYHRLFWDITGQSAIPVPGGIYFCQIKTGKNIDTIKLIVCGE